MNLRFIFSSHFSLSNFPRLKPRSFRYGIQSRPIELVYVYIEKKG